MSHNIVVKGRLKRGKWHFGIELQQWNSSALMSHKTSSKHGFSIWKHLHAESSALTVHERACSLRTSLPDTRKNKLAFKPSTAKDMKAKGGKQQATNLCRPYIRISVNAVWRYILYWYYQVHPLTLCFFGGKKKSIK